MSKYVAMIAIVWLLCGCSISADPFGASERAQIRARADVEVAQAERDAAIGVAQAEASKSQAWAMVAPFLAAVIMAGIIIGVIVWWQGKIYYVRATMQPQSAMLLPGQPGFYPALRQVARHHNAQIEMDNGRYYLIAEDNSYEVKALPAVRNG